jgi:hypothetical protein
MRALLSHLCTPVMGMNLWGVSPLSEDNESTMLTIVTTSQRQGQYCEVLSGGSLGAKRRADEQERDIRLNSRAERAQDREGWLSALYSQVNKFGRRLRCDSSCSYPGRAGVCVV